MPKRRFSDAYRSSCCGRDFSGARHCLCVCKGAFLIAGYNTASAEEKAQYDEKKLCRAVSKLMFALAACWVVAALSEIFKNMIFLWVGIALFAVVIVVGVVWINTGDRCKK